MYGNPLHPYQKPDKVINGPGFQLSLLYQNKQTDNEPGPPGNSEIAVIHNSAAATLNNSPNNCTKCQSRKRIMGHIKFMFAHYSSNHYNYSGNRINSMDL